MYTAFINEQEGEIQRLFATMNSAAAAKAEAHFEILRATIGVMNIAQPDTYEMLGALVLPALVLPDKRFFLEATLPMTGELEPHLKRIQQDLERWERDEPEVGRTFRRILCHMHPETLGLLKDVK